MANSEDIPGTPEEDIEMNGKEQDQGQEAEQEEQKVEPEPSASDNDKEKEEGSGEEDDDGEEEEEYEIEKIISARKGQFAGGEFGYLVKWKGYGPEHNSWVRESDAGNAQDLINTYWKEKKEAQRSKQNNISRGRASLKANSASMSPAVESTSTKRGRGKATAKSVSEDEDEEDTGSRRKKKRLNTAANGANGSNKRSSLAALNKAEDEGVQMPDLPTEPSEGQFTTMKALKYSAIKSWEDIVKQITTIEKTGPQGELMVYFETTEGKLVREPSAVCRKRFPSKLFDFYESHLKWKASDEDLGQS